MSDSTPRLDPRVLDAMRPYFSERFGNPSSQNHAYGEEAHLAVEEARQAIATLIGAPSTRGIIFTSGAAESDHLAVHGALESVTPTHPARWVNVASGVRPSFRRPVEIISIAMVGHTVELAELERVLQSKASTEASCTTLISIRAFGDDDAAKVPAIRTMANEHGALLHVSGDGRCVGTTEIDLLSIDGTTLGTPAGVGVLCVRRRSPPLRLQAQVPGGGQESGLRGGTLNVPGIVGLGAAATFKHAERATPR